MDSTVNVIAETCPGATVSLEGRQGVFISGTIQPAIKGVQIVITSEDNELNKVLVESGDKGDYGLVAYLLTYPLCAQVRKARTRSRQFPQSWAHLAAPSTQQFFHSSSHCCISSAPFLLPFLVAIVRETSMFLGAWAYLRRELCPSSLMNRLIPFEQLFS